MMEFDLEYTLGLFPILLKYLGTTMEMALWGFVLALVLSLALAIVRVFASRNPLAGDALYLVLSGYTATRSAVPALLRTAATVPESS